MKTRILIALILLIPLGIGYGSIVKAQESTHTPVTPMEEATLYDPLERDPYDVSSELAIYTDTALSGLVWFPEKPGKFAQYKYSTRFAGTRFSAKSPGSYWIDISIPLETARDGSPRLIYYVEFCGYSSNETVVKPTAWQLWEEENLFYNASIDWAGLSVKKCVYKQYDPPESRQSLAASVYVKFNNTTDTFTLKKAWVRTVP